MCHPTYKDDWDLPGGVVEVRESPREAAGREVLEELGLRLPMGRLVLADWLPPWGGWDDAHVPGLRRWRASGLGPRQGRAAGPRDPRHGVLATSDTVHARAADYTARRVDAALSAVEGSGAVFTESGRPV